MPSPRPVRPRPSVVVADRLTGAPPMASPSTFSASPRRGPILGRLPMTWTDTLPMTNPAASTRRATSRSRSTPDAPPRPKAGEQHEPQLASQNFVEERFGLVLVGLFRQCELTDQDLPGLG